MHLIFWKNLIALNKMEWAEASLLVKTIQKHKKQKL